MKKPVNQSNIEGRVFNHSLEGKVSGEASKNPGTPYIAGNVEIATDEEGLNVVQVHYTYVAPTYASGSENRNYKALEKIMNGPTWSADGKENALVVRLTPSLALNDFYPNGGEGDLVSQQRLDGGFINILNGTATLKPEAERSSFKADVVITNVNHVDANEETGTPEKVNVKAAAFNYNGTVLLPYNFTVKSEDGMKYFDSLDVSSSNPIFTQVWGNIEATTTTSTRTTESAFGEAKVETVSRTTRDWVITGMKLNAYEFGGEELSVEEFQKLIQDRNVYLAEQKKNAQEYASRSGNTQAAPATAAQAAAPAVGNFKF